MLDGLDVNDAVTQSAETPLATEVRSYLVNPLFAQSTLALPGDLQTVLAPFALRCFADGYSGSAADIGALAKLEMPGHSILVSAGSLRNALQQRRRPQHHPVVCT